MGQLVADQSSFPSAAAENATLSSARLAHLPPLRFHPRGSDFDTQSSINLQLRNRRDERRLRPDTSPVLWSLAGYDCATPWCNQSVCPPAYQTLFSRSQLRASLGPVEPCTNWASGQDLAHGMGPEAVERSVQRLNWSIRGQRMASSKRGPSNGP